MKMQSKFSVEQITILCAINRLLMAQTGINFVDRLTDIANNDKKTELDAKDFIKQNYPIKTGLTPTDFSYLSILLDFYLYKVDVHDSTETDITLYECKPKEVPYEGSLDRCLSVFLQNKNPFEKSFAGDFFPLD